MGTIQHKAMLVTSCDLKQLKKAHTKALKLFDKSNVTKITGCGMNGYKTFVIVPCGSKLEWPEDVEHDESMAKFKEYCDDKFTYEDGSSAISRVLVNYGELGLQAEDDKGHQLDSRRGHKVETTTEIKLNR